MKNKTRATWSLKTKLGLPYLILPCLFFFVAGVFVSNLLSQDIPGDRTGRRLAESVVEYRLMPNGETGEDTITIIPYQVLSWRPRALYFPKFATPAECESIINLAKPGLKPSLLALREGETEENTKGTRTSWCQKEFKWDQIRVILRLEDGLKLAQVPAISSGVFLSASEDKTGVLDAIEEKIARATMFPRTHGESFNILRYQLHQKYDSHYDAFNPAEYGPQKSQRAASFLLYLSDVEEGGETVFPYENGGNMDGNYDYRECVGLKIKPRQGDALLFHSLYPNGTIDPLSLHGSCPVIKGEKWVATKWIRDEIQEDN